MFASVRTLDIGLGAEAIFTQRGKAAWYFDGTGAVANGVWTPTADAKNTGDPTFAAVTDGSLVSKTTGTAFNSVLAGAVWETKGG